MNNWLFYSRQQQLELETTPKFGLTKGPKCSQSCQHTLLQNNAQDKEDGALDRGDDWTGPYRKNRMKNSPVHVGRQTVRLKPKWTSISVK